MSSAVPELCEVIENLAHGSRLTTKSRRILEGAAQSWPVAQLDHLTADDVERICGCRYDTVQDGARAALDSVGG